MGKRLGFISTFMNFICCRKYQTSVANADDCSGFRSLLYFPINEPSSAIPATLPTFVHKNKG